MTSITWTTIPGANSVLVCATARGTYVLQQRELSHGYDWKMTLAFAPTGAREGVLLLTILDSPFRSGLDQRRIGYQAWVDRYAAGATLHPVVCPVKGEILGYAETEADALAISRAHSRYAGRDAHRVAVTMASDIGVVAGTSIPRAWVVVPPSPVTVPPAAARRSPPVAMDSYAAT